MASTKVAIALAVLVGCRSSAGPSSEAVATIASVPAAEISASPATTASARAGKEIPAPSPRRIGAGHTVGCLLADGKVRCWGRDDAGQLGDGKVSHGISKPGRPVDGLPPVRSIAVGFATVYALTESGEVFAWGAGESGQLGDGASIPPAGSPGWAHSSKPVRVLLPSKAAAIDAGTSSACAALVDGAVACWGDNLDGQLGHKPAKVDPSGGINDATSTPIVVDGVSEAVEVAVGTSTACARRRSGSVLCWGETQSDHGSGPAPIAALCARQITAGSSFGCALDCEGRSVCWGGEPGSGPKFERAVHPLAAPFEVTEIRAGYWHVCLRGAAGEVACFGSNTSGQLGTGKSDILTGDITAEINRVKGPWRRVDALAAGGVSFKPDARYAVPRSYAESGQTCVLADDHDVYCWGEPNLDWTPKRLVFP